MKAEEAHDLYDLLREAISLLKEVEFEGVYHSEPCCPWCINPDGDYFTHKADCKYVQFMNKVGK